MVGFVLLLLICATSQVWPQTDRVAISEEGKPLGRFKFDTSKILGDSLELRLRGTRGISFGGSSVWTEGEVQTVTGRPSKFPSLNMDQLSNLSLNAKAGDRLQV